MKIHVMGHLLLHSVTGSDSVLRSCVYQTLVDYWCIRIGSVQRIVCVTIKGSIESDGRY